MACESDGALEIFIEPMLPHPQVVVIGRSHAVFALTKLARALDWDIAVIDDAGSASDHPYQLVRTSLDLTGLGIGRASAIVVATQGHYDDLALEAAFATSARLHRPCGSRQARSRDAHSCAPAGSARSSSAES